MQKRIQNLIAAMLLTLLLCGMLSTADQEQTTVEVSPNSFTIEEGQLFTVSIIVDPHETIDTFGADYIKWDPGMAKLNGKPERGDLFEDATIWINGKEIDNVNGTLQYTAWGSTIPTDKSGTFIHLNFTALKDGTFNIHLVPEETVAAAAGKEVVSTILNNPDEPKTQPIDKEDSGNKGSVAPVELIVIGVAGVISVIIGVFILFFRNGGKEKAIQKEKKEQQNSTQSNDERRDENPIQTNEDQSKKSTVIKFQKS